MIIFLTNYTGAGGPRPSEIRLPTTDILFNMTERNISDWLVKTIRQYAKRRSVYCNGTNVHSVLRFVIFGVYLKMGTSISVNMIRKNRIGKHDKSTTLNACKCV